MLFIVAEHSKLNTRDYPKLVQTASIIIMEYYLELDVPVALVIVCISFCMSLVWPFCFLCG